MLTPLTQVNRCSIAISSTIPLITRSNCKCPIQSFLSSTRQTETLLETQKRGVKMNGCTCRGGSSSGKITAKEFVKMALELSPVQTAIRCGEGKVEYDACAFYFPIFYPGYLLEKKGLELPNLDDVLKEWEGLTIEVDKNWRILDKEKADKEIYDRIYGKMDFEAMRNKRKKELEMIDKYEKIIEKVK